MTDPYIYDPGNPNADKTYSRHTISAGSDAPPVVVDVGSGAQAQNERLIRVMRLIEDLAGAAIRGGANKLDALLEIEAHASVAVFRETDPTQTPAERTEVDES